MKIVNPTGPVNLLPLLGKSNEVLVQPPLYIGNQINFNPAWLAWCEQVYAVTRDEAVWIATDKAVNGFDGDPDYIRLDTILDQAVDNFKTQDKATVVLNKKQWKKYPC